MDTICSNEERPWISFDIASLLNETLLPLVAECKSESGWDPVKQGASCIVGGSSSLEVKSLSHGWVFVQKAWRLFQGDQSCEIGALKSCPVAESDTRACIGAGAAQAKKGGPRKPSDFYAMEGATWTRDLEKTLSLSLPIQVCKESRSSSNGKKSSGCKKPPRPPKPHSKAPAAHDSASAARSAIEAMRVSSMQKRVEKIARKNRASTAAAAGGASMDLSTIISLAFTIFVAALILFQGLASFSANSSQQKQQAVLLNQPVLQSSKPMDVKEGWTPLILAQHELVVDNDSHFQAAESKAPTTRRMEARIFLRQK